MRYGGKEFSADSQFSECSRRGYINWFSSSSDPSRLEYRPRVELLVGCL